jgi:hypothetical protein
MADDFQNNGGEDGFYSLVPEQGLCLVDDVIVNLKQVSVIRKLDGKTLVYCATSVDPVILPVKAFEQIKDAVFAMDDDEDFEDEDEDEDMD